MAYSSQQIQSTVTSRGQLKLCLGTDEVGEPGPDEIVVRIDAAPINPPDLGLLFGPADMTTARESGSPQDPILIADIPAGPMASMKTRVDKPMRVGNEGAGVVVATGEAAAARALLGTTVGIVGGSMYSQYRKIHAGACLPMPEGITPVEAAGFFINPMTALGMLETMRLEGHSALVHTAAASNLGQMLNKLCIADGVELVNIVRKPEQEEILKSIGATHIVNSEAASFKADLVDALSATGATLAFDAVGGGKLAARILGAMEKAQNANATEFSRYGSATHKQVYIYGGLDPSPTVLSRGFGMAWGVGGWLLTPLLQRVGGEGIGRLRARVAAEITTTFASHYTKQISLAQALRLDAIAAYGRQATGEKYLITPHGGR